MCVHIITRRRRLSYAFLVNFCSTRGDRNAKYRPTRAAAAAAAAVSIQTSSGLVAEGGPTAKGTIASQDAKEGEAGGKTYSVR